MNEGFLQLVSQRLQLMCRVVIQKREKEDMSKILAFSGSSRRGSFNKQLVKIAAIGAEEAGASVTVIDLADHPMPLFDAGLEAKEGIPENALKFKRLLMEHDAIMIASPQQFLRRLEVKE